LKNTIGLPADRVLSLTTQTLIALDSC